MASNQRELGEKLLGKELGGDTTQNRVNSAVGEIVDNVIYLLPRLENITTIEDAEKRNQLQFIIKVLSDKSDFFDGFISENPELLDGNYNLKKLDNYVDSFLSYQPLVEALRDCRLEKEKIVDNELNTLFEECLYRTNNKAFQHWELLKIYTTLGRSIDIAKTVYNKLFSEIEYRKIEGTFSFNLEVSDLMNEGFLNNFITRYETIKNSGLNSKIVVEVLENQVIEDVNKFKKILERMKDIGILIAFDDIMQIGSHLEKIGNIENLFNNHKGEINAVKIDGRTLQNLYELYNKGELDKKKLMEIQEFIRETISSGIFVVGEWIEDEKIFEFARDILGVSHFQGYAFKKN